MTKKKKSKVEFRSYDAAEYIETPSDVAHYLEAAFEAAFEDDDPRLIAAMLGDIARSKGMATIAEETGLSRETLYRALSADGNPTLVTLHGVLKSLGLRLAAIPITPSKAA